MGIRVSYNAYLEDVALSVFVLVLIALIRRWRTKIPYPPGPPGYPIIGNVFDMPTMEQKITYTKWGKQYGPLSFVKTFGQPIIIINSSKAASDLLDKRGAFYSDRPVLPMAGELVGYSQSLALAHYDSVHRQRRRIVFDTFGPHQVSYFHAFMATETQKFLNAFLTSPLNLAPQIRAHVASIVFEISHGYTVTGSTDPFVLQAEKSNKEFNICSQPGAFLVDALPILRHIPDWFPLASFKRKAKEWRKSAEDARDMPFDFVRAQLARNEARPSFAANILLKKPNMSSEEELSMRWLTFSIYGAGVDTTSAAIHSFILAMLKNPDIQRQGQAEIDSVVGAMRLPSLADRPHLPYVNGICNEVFRLAPPVPVGIPHVIHKDDIYEGHFIPAKTILLVNAWGICRDPNIYPSPEVFNPRRYLNSKVPDINPDPIKIVFGFGRRFCPGKYLASDILFIAAAMILATFDIRPGKDGIPEGRFQNGLVSHPEPFECSITPRSHEAANLVKEMPGVH